MKSRIFVIGLILLFVGIACQRSVDLTEPVSHDPFANTLSKKGAVPDNFIIFEEGYSAQIMVDNIRAPEGTGMLSNGELFVLQSTLANVLQVTPSGMVSELAQIPFQEPPAPALIDLLIDPPRGMFVTLLRHGQVFSISFSGQVTEFASGLNFPLFMALDSDKNIYVSELFDFQITRLDQAGNEEVVIELDSDTRPRGIVFDEQERLYILSRNGEIRRFDVMTAASYPMPLSSGTLIATVSENQPQDMTFGFDDDLFVVSENNIYRVKLNGDVSIFATGLGGPFNVINQNVKGDLIVSDYAQDEEGAGRVIRISPSKGKQKSGKCITPPSDLVAWWPGDLHANDIVGNHNGTLQNGATYGAGMVDQAFSFDGVDDYVRIDDHSEWTFGDDAFTIDLWAKFNGLPDRAPLVDHNEGGGETKKWVFWYDASGHRDPGGPALRFHINSPSLGPLDPVVYPWEPVIGQWYHLAITREGANYSLYINGSHVITEQDNNTIPDADVDLSIGQSEFAYWFDGLIDEVEIFNRALSASEIKTIYDAGSAGKCK